MLSRLWSKGRFVTLSHSKYFSTLKGQDLWRMPQQLCQKVAMEDMHGKHTYGSLLTQSYQLARSMKSHLGRDSLKGERIVYLTPNDCSNVVTLWAIWMNQAIGVPLCVAHPLSEKQYFVNDSKAKLIIGTESHAEEVFKLSKQSSTSHLIIPTASVQSVDKDDIPSLEDIGSTEASANALMIYTSGTTGRPKGVVLSHGNIKATSDDMIESWEWTSADTCLHILPLHHIHGLVNTLLVPLSVGAKCVMLPQFNAEEVWRRLMSADDQISVFTSVPTVYAKLLEHYERVDDPNLNPQAIRQAFERVRLMISGSNALPLPVKAGFKALTGHNLLERYGMTEILMALTHPIDGIRSAGTVGLPFKSVDTIIAKEDATAEHGYIDVTNKKSTDNPDQSVEGELYVKGPTVFVEYWNKPEATRDAFTSDGWFKTGDTMCIDADGYYKVLGRTSVDIIKSSGYKISALDIESKLLRHESIAECAVVGVPDSVYGQRITALIVFKIGATADIDTLKTWCLEHMPPYSIPREFNVLGSIPRNAMGKVNKKALTAQYYPNAF